MRLYALLTTPVICGRHRVRVELVMLGSKPRKEMFAMVWWRSGVATVKGSVCAAWQRQTGTVCCSRSWRWGSVERFKRCRQGMGE